VLLEREPPLNAFEHHSARTLTNNPFSQLLDSRVQLIHLGRLKALDTMTETRRRLGTGGSKGDPRTRPGPKGDGGTDDATGKGGKLQPPPAGARTRKGKNQGKDDE